MSRTLDCIINDSGDRRKLGTLHLDASFHALEIIDYEHHENHGDLQNTPIRINDLSAAATGAHTQPAGFPVPPSVRPEPSPWNAARGEGFRTLLGGQNAIRH